MVRLVGYWAGLMMVGAIGGLEASGDRAAPIDLPPVVLTVDPQNTRITGPMRKDGTIDYVSAINAMLGEGVRPENNAAVQMMSLMRQETVTDVVSWIRLFQQWQVAMPDRRTLLFTPFEHWNAGQGDDPEASSDWLRAYGGPWTVEEFPRMAAWLDSQNAVLDSLKEAIALPQFWLPYGVPRSRDSLMADPLDAFRALREVARSLCVRGYRYREAGQIGLAIEDALAARRLAYHMRSQVTTLEQVMALDMASMANALLIHLIFHEALTLAQIREIARELDGAEEVWPIARAARWGERFTFLDKAQWGFHAYERWLDLPRANHRLAQIIHHQVDHDRVFFQANRFYDRVASMLDQEDPLSRDQQLKEWLFPIDHDRVDWLWLEKPSHLEAFLRGGNLQSRREKLTDWWTQVLLVVATPSWRGLARVESRVRMQGVLLQVAVAGVGWRAEHGSYPLTLEAMVPAWLPQVPRDLFDPAGGAVTYRVESDQVVLASKAFNPWASPDGHGGQDEDQTLVLTWKRR